MQTLTQIRELLERAGHAPKKSLGQNFLIDHNLINKLLDAAELSPGELVLEVGPGTGTLTEGLLERGARVIACELDTGLSQVLRETLGAQHPDRFTLIEGDCLANKRTMNTEVATLLADRPGGFKLVANLPYHAATPLMMTLMTKHPGCTGMFVTIQSEVVDRLTGSPGTKAFGSISVVTQHLGRAERIAKLPPACFWPRPEVTSAMMAWRRNPAVPVDPAWWVRLADITQTLFQSRRKQLAKPAKQIAGGGADIDWPDGVDPTARIEDLSVDHMVALAAAIDRARDRSDSPRRGEGL
ncbi:MAG: 16S rRNA (adenine(1518)-N(6)/adenine(1519)-N(6))-dimethyltransferase RsmA [Phycisphaerales bacterium]|nr:ribosomal RNA small subunit methyltransferase A [Planctomycetota bacterium]MCH8509855.1 16S rRNA (adenine(1518)-N(6)/adenine(1519)-N(6))-dimethyltransferase RsmA [Phycisphaerales bacterium]